MSIVLHDSERDTKPPLESELPQPASFHVYSCLIAAAFVEDRVFFPLGIEDACNQPSIGVSGTEESKRPRAPFPRATDAGSPPDALGIRPMYSAYLAARFIVYYDSRVTPAQFSSRGLRGQGGASKEMISYSMLAEMANAMSIESDSTRASGRSNAAPTGPHGSQCSRRFAVTLLLPRAVSGRAAANRNDVMFLDALALISASTDRPCFSVDADGLPHATSVGRKSSRTPRPLTDTVRLSVVAGSAAVAAFANGIGLSSNELFSGEDWKRNAIVCFSYISGKNVVHTPCVLDDGVVATMSAARCVRTLQNAALRAQVLSKGELVLPQGFLSADYVNLDEESTGESPFLQIQAEHQLRFRRLHLKETSVEIPHDSLQRLKIGSTSPRARFVRICSKNASANSLCDESHCPGMLFSSNEDLMLEYLNRNRLANPPPAWTRTWPPYGVGAPVDEERDGCLSLLWWRLETQCIGNNVNLFFPRTLMGERVTDIDDSRIFSVVPALCPVENVFYNKNFVLPCTPHSMIPVGPHSTSLYSAFASALDESCEFLFKLSCPMGMAEVDTTTRYLSIAHSFNAGNGTDECGEAVAQPPKVDDESDFIAALMGLRIGHPTSTCGDVYTSLQHRSTSELASSKSFCNLVATGVSKLGADVPMHEVMDAAATALAEKLSLRDVVSSASSQYNDSPSESERKRTRTPYGHIASPTPASHPPPQITSSLRQDSHASGLSDATILHNPKPIAQLDFLRRHWTNPINAARILALAGLDTFQIRGFEHGTMVSFPMGVDNLEDLLETIWLANGIGYKIYEEESSQSKDGKLLSERIGMPAACKHTDHVSVFEHWFSFAYNAYHRVMAQHGHDICSDVDTFVLFRRCVDADAVLYVLKKHTESGEVFLEESTTEALLQPLKKMTRLVFTVSQPDQAADALSLPFETKCKVWRSVPGNI